MIRFLFAATAITFSFGQLGRVSFFGQELNMYLYELCAAGVLGLLGLRYRHAPHAIFFKSLNSVPIFLFYLMISFLWFIPSFSQAQNIISFAYILRLIFYFHLLAYLHHHVAVVKKDREFMKNMLGISLLLILFFSVMQYSLYPNLRNLSYAGWDPHLFRVFGTFLEPVILASVLGIFIFWGMFEEFLFTPAMKFLAMAGAFVLFLLTYSRGTYIAFIIAEASILFQYYKKYILYGLILFIAGISLLPKPFGEGVNLLRTATIESRVENYREAFTLFQKHPFIGWGYDRIRYVKEANNILSNTEDHSGSAFHSSFLTMLVAGGVIGLLLYLYMLWNIMQLGRYAFYVMVFLGIASLTDNILLHAFILFLSSTTIALSRSDR